MSDWIDDAAERIERENARLQATKEFRDAAQAVLISAEPNVLAALFEAVTKDVEHFNTRFSLATQLLQEPVLVGNSGFRVERQYDPSFLLDVSADKNSPVISWNLRQSQGKDGYQTSGSFEIYLNRYGEAGLVDRGHPIAYEEASHKLLVPALQGLTKPIPSD